MRLQKQSVGEIRGREYSKYVIIVPPSDVETLGWKSGEELEHEVKDQELIIRKAAEATEEENLKLAAKYAKRKRR